MKIYNLKSNAKINIGLNVLERLDNGYHTLDMVILPIDLTDDILIKIGKNEGDLKIFTNKKDIPIDKGNIINKVRTAFYDKTKLTPLKMEVYLEKRIPHQAGLGGGSSNGAVILDFLNNYHNKPLSFEELIEVGKSIGADIPFFLLNKPARVQGIGDILTEIENNLNNGILLIKPTFGVSTALAYREVDSLKEKKMANLSLVIEGLKENRLDLVIANIENNLEEALLLKDSVLLEFKERFSKLEGMEFFMSGSGSSYFAFMQKKSFLDNKNRLDLLFNDCEIYFCNFK